MPGTSAATQSSRCGKSPNEPSRVSATMLDTSVLSAKIWNGSRTLRCMRVDGMFDFRLRFRLGLRMRFGRGLGRSPCGRIQLGLRFGFRTGLRLWLRLGIRCGFTIGLWFGLISRFGVALGFGFLPWFGWRCGLCGFRFCLRFANRPDHVKRAFRVVFEFIAQDSLTAVQRILEADELSFRAGELLGREKGLGEKTLQPAGADDHVAVLRRKLLQAEHGNDVLEFPVLCERPPDFLRQEIMPFADNARGGHLGTGLQGVDRREKPFAGPLAREHD